MPADWQVLRFSGIVPHARPAIAFRFFTFWAARPEKNSIIVYSSNPFSQ